MMTSNLEVEQTHAAAPNNRLPILASIGVSAAAIIFLLWLIYLHHPVAGYATRLRFLPALNAVLNALCATALIIGFNFIRQRRVAAHRASMITAFVFSFLFLISYIANYAVHGESHFPGHGAIRTAYLSILVSHILLSMVVLPLVLITFFFALTGRFSQHRKIARFTFPIWMYVSVTGVVVYAMLAAWH